MMEQLCDNVSINDNELNGLTDQQLFIVRKEPSLDQQSEPTQSQKNRQEILNLREQSDIRSSDFNEYSVYKVTESVKNGRNVIKEGSLLEPYRS